ncbi:hypothetical protein Pfo_020466 [Paulownia fortunei]|nr:hypothetical protein Pfo_020466 [Paulownia fortunei]
MTSHTPGASGQDLDYQPEESASKTVSRGATFPQLEKYDAHGLMQDFVELEKKGNKMLSACNAHIAELDEKLISLQKYVKKARIEGMELGKNELLLSDEYKELVQQTCIEEACDFIKSVVFKAAVDDKAATEGLEYCNKCRDQLVKLGVL